MIDQLNHLIQTLREELQQYGELLARLDQQQEFVMRRSSDEVLASVTALQEQAAVIREARVKREAAQRELASELSLPKGAGFAVIAPLLPANHRLLIQALVDENNALLVRVQQRSRQNHVLLTRSLELMQSFINKLLPAGDALVYTGRGSLAGRALGKRSRYQAVG